MLRGETLSAERIGAVRDELIARADKALAGERVGVRVAYELRYVGQSFELSVEQATASRANAQYNLKARDLQLTNDVTSAYLNVTAAARTAAMQEANAATARDALELATQRYSVGAGTYLDVTDARAAYEQLAKAAPFNPRQHLGA